MPPAGASLSSDAPCLRLWPGNPDDAPSPDTFPACMYISENPASKREPSESMLLGPPSVPLTGVRPLRGRDAERPRPRPPLLPSPLPGRMAIGAEARTG